MGWSEGEARAVGSRDQIGWSGGCDRDGHRLCRSEVSGLECESDGFIIGTVTTFRYAAGPDAGLIIANHWQAVRRAARRLQLLWWKVIDDGAR